MSTAVIKNMDFAIEMADHHDRFLADFGVEIVARIGGLTVLTDENPSIGEAVLHLKIEDFPVNIEIAMYLVWPNLRSHDGGIVGVTGHAGALDRGKNKTAQRGVTKSMNGGSA